MGINCMVRLTLGMNIEEPVNRSSSTFQSGLVNGGPAVLIYGLLLSWLGSLAVGASLAEMASMHVALGSSVNQLLLMMGRSPTSGGQYHWVAQLAPARYAVTFSWAAGKSLLSSLSGLWLITQKAGSRYLHDCPSALALRL